MLPVALYKVSKTNVEIASDIPASDQACVNTQSSNQSELSQRENIQSEAATAFSSENFEKLESYYSIYRQRTSLTVAGLWKLNFFYKGIFNNDLNSPKYQDDKNWMIVESKIKKWMELSPKSPAPYIVYSNFLIARGWHFRGDGYSSEVTSEGWDLLRKNIKLAREILEKSKDITSVDPQWYTNMAEIAMLQSWSKTEVNKLLHEALSKEAYYHETYYAIFRYLLPKWSGSFTEAQQFASDAARITSKCEGEGMYARIYWRAFNIHGEFTQDKPFASNQVNWKRMSAGFEDIIERYPSFWNVNNYAKFACFAQDKGKTKELISRINNQPIMEAWGNFGFGFSYCQKWAFEK